MPGRGDRFLVWGAGGHGAVVADLIECAGYALAGFVDADPVGSGSTGTTETRVLGEFELLDELERERRLPGGATALALGLGDNANRLRAYRRIDSTYMPAVIHPRAVVARSATVAAGSVILAGAVVSARARIGPATIINSAAVVEHDCAIGEAVHVAPGAILTGGVRVETGAWIGAGATVLPGIGIGDHTIVGAGAVVTSDLPPGCTAIGIPARVVKGNEGVGQTSG